MRTERFHIQNKSSTIVWINIDGTLHNLKPNQGKIILVPDIGKTNIPSLSDSGVISLLELSPSISGEIPTPGGGGVISVSDITTTSLRLAWTEALDINTDNAAVIYRVYRSNSDNIKTLETTKTNGTPAGGFIRSPTLLINNLDSGTTYYFNVICKNSDNKESVYTAIVTTTLDGIAPVPGNSGIITTSDIGAEALTLNWTMASDETTTQSQLQYRVYRSSSDNISTIALIEQNGTAINSFTANIATLNVTSLIAETTYYFNIIVKDNAGNKAAYTTKTETTDVASGTLWSFGYNSNGSLGTGGGGNESTPVQVGALTWKRIGTGSNYSLAIKADGTLWSFGVNNSGQLATGDTFDQYAPIQVGALTNWKNVFSGNGSTTSFGIKTDGALWAWGNNAYGQLGLGDSGTNRSSPVQVGALTNWKSVDGSLNIAAVKTDGTLWSWGYGGNGVLGLGDTDISRSSPVQVGALTNWKRASCGEANVVAVKTDGTIWAWGYGGYGVNGQGDTTPHSSPIQIGALTNWAQADASGGFAVAVKTDGTLWSWGQNGSGQLGLGDTAARSSPVQIGALTNWKEVSCGGGFVIAVKTDNTIWSWGHNDNGQLGLGDIINRSSPVQIGALSTWKTIECGGSSSLLIKSVS